MHTFQYSSVIGRFVIALSLSSAAYGDITPTGDVSTPAGPLPSGQGPVIIPPTDTITIGDASALAVDAASLLEAGGIDTVLGGNSAFSADGTGTVINLLGDFNRIDIRSNGTFNVSNGALVDGSAPCTTGCPFFFGNFSGGTVNLNVTTGGVLDTTADAMVVGAARADGGTPQTNSTANVNIFSGGLINSSSVFLSTGATADPTGTLFTDVTVSVFDQGSLWSVSDLLQVGSGLNSTALVQIAGGGAVDVATQMSMADFAGSSATVNIIGPDSQLNVGDDLVVGRVATGTAQLSLSDGAILNVGGGADNGQFTGANFFLIGFDGANGNVLADASIINLAASETGAISRLHIGEGGTGNMTLTGGTVLDVLGSQGVGIGDGFILGRSGVNGSDGIGTLTVDGSAVSLTGDLVGISLGESNLPGTGTTLGRGVMNVTNGSSVTLDGTTGRAFIQLGSGGNSQGELNIDGDGSIVTLTGDTASMSVATAFTGTGDGSGIVNVTNAGQLLLTGPNPGNNTMFVGFDAGNGIVNVDTGGLIQIDGALLIATTGGTETGVVNVNGTGAMVVSEFASVGAAGTLAGSGTFIAPSLNVNGGVLALDDLSGIDFLSFGEAPSVLTLPNDTLLFGREGGQDFGVFDSGAVQIGNAEFGAGTGNSAFFSVSGAGAALTVDDTLNIGSDGGSATSVVADGGMLVSGLDLSLGNDGGSTGSLLVDNAEVQLSGTTGILNLDIGDGGDGSLSVLNSGRVLIDAAGSGFQAGMFAGATTPGFDGNADIQISGANSLLQINSDAIAFIHLGLADGVNAGSATMTVEAGADVVISGGTNGPGDVVGALLALGGGTGSSGDLTVTGPGSSVSLSGSGSLVRIGNDILVPGGGTATLTVTDQALLEVIGTDPAQTNLDVGNIGNGILSVTQGGEVVVAGNLNIATGTGTGQVTIASLGSISAINTTIGANGALTGDGSFQTDTLELRDGGILDILDYTGIGTFSIVGTQLTTADLEFGSDAGQNIDLSGGAVLQVDGVFNLGTTAGASADLSLTGPNTQLNVVGNTAAGLNVGGFGGTASITADNGAQIFIDSATVAPDFTIETGSSVTMTGQGSGILMQAGAGLQSSVTVDGTLVLNDAAGVVADIVAVGNGGTLGGNNGFINGNTFINVGGTLGPGNSPGTLTINGNLNLDGGSIALELAGDQPGQFDVVNVNGDLNLNSGSVDLILLNNFSPATGSTFNVLDVSGNVAQDPGVAIGFAGLGPDFEFVFSPGGSGTVGALNFLAVDIAEIPILSTNQGSAGEALDDLCPRIEGLDDPSPEEQDLDLLCGGLRNSNNTPEQIARALDAITPDEVTGTIDTLLRFTGTQHGNLSMRLNGLRSGAAPRVDVSGLNIVTDHVRLSGVDLQRALSNLVGGSAGTDDFARWGFFSDINYRDGENGASEHQPGFDFETVTFTLGTDYRLRDNLYLGAALGYSEVNGDFDVGGGMFLKTTTLTLMGTYFKGDSFYVDALVTYGWADSESRRRIVYDTVAQDVDRTAKGDSDAYEFVSGFGTGWDFNRGKWVFGPHLGANYTEIGVDRYDETGAGGLNLSLRDQVSRTLTANAGFHLSYTMTPAWGVLVPYLRVDYTHEFKHEGQSPDVAFVNDRFRQSVTNPTSSFDVLTEDSDPNYLVWSAGVHVQLIRGIAGFINYQDHAQLKRLDLQGISAGLRFEKTF